VSRPYEGIAHTTVEHSSRWKVKCYKMRPREHHAGASAGPHRHAVPQNLVILLTLSSVTEL
jgi:hypothetical protein